MSVPAGIRASKNPSGWRQVIGTAADGPCTNTDLAPGTSARMTSPAWAACGPSTAKGSPWRAPTMAAMSALLARQADAAMMLVRLPTAALEGRLHIPNVVAIFADRPVGGEPANARGIENAGAPPRRRVPPFGGDASLRGGVRIKVGGNEEVVVICQHIHQVTEAVRVTRRKPSRANRFKRAMQWQ